MEGREGKGVHEGEGEGEGEAEGREEQDVQHGSEGEGEGGEEGEGVRGRGSESEGEGEVEEGEGGIDPQPQQPAGHTEYSLSPEQVSQPIESQVQFTESYLEPVKHHFQDIDQNYKEVLDKRTEIDDLLKQFKAKLKLQGNADFPTCFQQLRELVGDFDQLELSKDEPLHIILGEEADGNGVGEAVEMFNSMLQKCREFPAEAKAATALIQEKIRDVESEHLQVEKTMKALEKSKGFLEQIRIFGGEIEKLVRDVKWARRYLLSKRVSTGMIRIIN